MTSPTPANVARLRPCDAEDLLGMLEELTRRVDYLTRTIEKHEAKLGDVDEALDAHEDRLNTLDAANTPKPRPGEELRARVEVFVNANPTLRLTALVVVAESIGENNNRVGTALDTLARQGRIADDRRDGKTRMYFAGPASAGGAR